MAAAFRPGQGPRMSLDPGGVKACAVSPSAGTLMPPTPDPGTPFFAPVYVYGAVYGAAPLWTGLKGQFACLFAAARDSLKSAELTPGWPATQA